MGIYNCDWLSFTIDFENYNGMFGQGKETTLNPEYNKHLSRLFAQLDEQRENQDKGFIDLGLWKFEVMNHGSRSYYYLLHNEDMEIRLARYRSKTNEVYPVFVHFKSQFLWSDIYGISKLEDKFKLVVEWLQDVLNGKYIASKINRIDLAYHTDDVPSDFNADQFVGRHTLDTTRRTHRVVSGIDIGSRRSEKIFLRCYNKYLEARSTKKQWFFAIWEHHKLNIRKVWNIEFQCNREFFSEFRVGRRKLDTVEEVLSRLPALWFYLTNDWVSYRIPDHSRRSMWSFHPWWANIANYHECEEKIARDRQREIPTADMLIPAIRGFLSSYCARTGNDLQDGTLFRQLVEQINEYEEKSDKHFDKDVEKKRTLMDPRIDFVQIQNDMDSDIALETELHRMYRYGEIDEKPNVFEPIEQQYERLTRKKKGTAGTAPVQD